VPPLWLQFIICLILAVPIVKAMGIVHDCIYGKTAKKEPSNADKN
jgi:hypothetical protein